MTRAGVVLLLCVLAGCRQVDNLPSYGVVPAFELIAQNGQPFHSRTLHGRIWVADFIFTTCQGPCPRMTSQMHRIQTAASNAVKLVSFTVDPRHDTPEVLAAYAKQHAALADRWYFLTGPQATLHKLDRDAFKLGDVDGSLMHSTRFVLVDGQSRIRGYYDTSEPDAIARVLTDIATLAEERF